jgi:hypothetical protein
VFPLHAARGIWANGLLSKAAVAAEGLRLRRNTTHAVDTLLGFGGLIHFYLPKHSSVDVSTLPILHAQMGDAPSPPFPHAVLVVDTCTLNDVECVVCNFNIAVSRPAYEGVRGGNHARGTDPSLILSHWEGFCRSNPDDERRRCGEWNEPMRVPTLRGPQITARAARVGYNAPKQRTSGGREVRVPELLLRSPFRPRADHPRAAVHVFSQADLASLGHLGNSPDWLSVQLDDAFPWYGAGDRVPPQIRASINNYLERGGPLPDLDYDARR